MGGPLKQSRLVEDPGCKKGRLTIAQLAAYDDVLTDVLVDHVSVTSLYPPSLCPTNPPSLVLQMLHLYVLHILHLSPTLSSYYVH